MLCSECKKRPATLHLTQYINGQKVELQVCEVCAKELSHQQEQDYNYSFQDLLTGLFHMTSSSMELEEEQYHEKQQVLTCDHCQMTFDEFQNMGKFGCDHCYETFSDKLDTIFRRVHSGNTKHYGKTPKNHQTTMTPQQQIEQLKEEMNTLIEVEAFEDAAIVRDKIKALQSERRGDSSP